MFKQLLNECIIDFTLNFDGPLLIKSGTIDVEGHEMNFVKTFRNGALEIFIPGSSLKGLIRSHSEKIIRTLSNGTPKCCDPFNDGKDKTRHDVSIACSTKFEWRKKGTKIKSDGSFETDDVDKEDLKSCLIYAHACPICKLFGSTSEASRIKLDDGYFIIHDEQDNQERHRQIRDGIGIDRFTGGTANTAKFDMEVFSDLKFGSRIYIRNFEIWQLGLLAYTLNDFKDGLASLGYGKSRGLGRFNIELDKIRISYLSPQIPEKPEPHSPALYGMKYLYGENTYEFSGLETEPVQVTGLQLPRAKDALGLRKYYDFKQNELALVFFKTVAPKFNDYLNNWNWNSTMQIAHFQTNGGD